MPDYTDGEDTEDIDARDVSETYWAADSDPKVLVTSLLDRAKDYYERMRRNGIWEAMSSSWHAYYGMNNDSGGYELAGTKLIESGEQGELTETKHNHFRSLIRHQLNLALQERSAISPRARNTDVASHSARKVASGVWEYARRERGLETVERDTMEMSLVLGEAYAWLDWDARVEGPTGEAKAGDIVADALNSTEVISDAEQKPRDRDWYMVRQVANKWDLIAQFPEIEKDLVDLKMAADTYGMGFGGQNSKSEDNVYVYHFYHRRCDALPNGRHCLFVSQDSVLIPPTDLPYKEIPVYRVAPSELIGTPHAYCDNWGLMPLQHAYDAAMSALVTNLDAFAVNNVAVEEGSDIGEAQLSGGLNFIPIPKGAQKPEPISMLQIPTAAYAIPELMKGDMQQLSGINSVMRGSTENIKSGAMGALFSGIAREFHSPLMREKTKLTEATAMGVLDIFQRMADGTRIAIIVGADGETERMEFERAQLEPIDRVVVEQKSPLEASAAGRFEIAQLAYQKDHLTFHEFLQVVRTGDIDSKFRPERIQEALIKRENEQLREGKEVIVMLSDRHHEHIQRHLSELATPEVRFQREFVDGVMKHVQEHMQTWQTAQARAPGLLEVLGVPPPPQQPGQQQPTQGGPPQNGQAGPPQPPPGMPPAPGMSGVPGEIRAPGAPGSAPNAPAIPQPPPNPLTGRPDVEGGPG